MDTQACSVHRLLLTRRVEALVEGMGLGHRTTRIGKGTCTSSARLGFRSKRCTKPFLMMKRGLCPTDGNPRRTTSRIAYLISADRYMPNRCLVHSDNRAYSHAIKASQASSAIVPDTLGMNFSRPHLSCSPQGNPRSYYYRSGDRQSTWDDPRSTGRGKDIALHVAKASPSPHQRSSSSPSEAARF